MLFLNVHFGSNLHVCASDRRAWYSMYLLGQVWLWRGADTLDKSLNRIGCLVMIRRGSEKMRRHPLLPKFLSLGLGIHVHVIDYYHIPSGWCNRLSLNREWLSKIHHAPPYGCEWREQGCFLFLGMSLVMHTGVLRHWSHRTHAIHSQCAEVDDYFSPNTNCQAWGISW